MKRVRAELIYDEDRGYEYEIHNFQISKEARKIMIGALERLNRALSRYRASCETEFSTLLFRLVSTIVLGVILAHVLDLSSLGFSLLILSFTLIISISLAIFFIKKRRFQKEFDEHVMLARLELSITLRDDVESSLK